jgi:hypothetical protein
MCVKSRLAEKLVALHPPREAMAVASKIQAPKAFREIRKMEGRGFIGSLGWLEG